MAERRRDKDSGQTGLDRRQRKAEVMDGGTSERKDG